MILLIDNYDSFTYNLYQLAGAINPDIQVIRNDKVTVEMVEQLAPSHLIISPGPGRPENAGACPQLVEHFSGRLPILGVCLGHQIICQVFGATITYAQTLMHGKSSVINLDTSSRLFSGLPQSILGARYHSLVAAPDSIPTTLTVAAQTNTGEVMAVEHCEHPVFGIQFHPESILTPQGKNIIANFLAVTGQPTNPRTTTGQSSNDLTPVQSTKSSRKEL